MQRWSWALVAGTGCVLSGCAFFTQPFTEVPPEFRQEKPLSQPATLNGQAKGKSQDADLPPDKAAKLCLAAADEMEKAGHIDHAIAQCELARQHNPKQPGISRKLAGLYARQGQFDKAIEEYQQELVKSPRDADLLNDVGYCCYEQKDYTSAEKYLRQAVALKPNLQRAHANLGLALGRQEKWKESLEEFKKAGSLSAAHANLAAMYHAAGKDEDATRECKIALGLDPQLKTARELLTALEDHSKEPTTIQQADLKSAPKSLPNIQLTEAQQEPVDANDGIRLSKPVIKKPQEEPTFRPLK